MSIIICEDCNLPIDTDHDTDHDADCTQKPFSVTDLGTYPQEVLEHLFPEQI